MSQGQWRYYRTLARPEQNRRHRRHCAGRRAQGHFCDVFFFSFEKHVLVAMLGAVSRLQPSLNFGADENLDVERSGRLVVSASRSVRCEVRLFCTSSRSGEDTRPRLPHGSCARCSCVQLRSRDEVRSRCVLGGGFRAWRSL